MSMPAVLSKKMVRIKTHAQTYVGGI